MRLHGSGKLITRDGNYRDGTYEIQVDTHADGHAARVAGFFDLEGEAAMRGVDEEFIGYATIVLDDTTEVGERLRGSGGHPGAAHHFLGESLR